MTPDYVPALRFRSLTSVYDPVARFFVRENRIKSALLEGADLVDGQRILDVGCGTGTLAIRAAERVPGAAIVGLDGDPQVLERAERKAAETGRKIRFDEALSTQLPYEDASFDRILSTLVFHHLTSADKTRTAAEIARVLRPGGRLHVADYGRPTDPLMWAAFTVIRGFDGFERTRMNVAGELPGAFERAGLGVDPGPRFRTVFGTVELFSASKPEA